MNTVFDAFPKDMGRIVYVRTVAVIDLPEDVQDQAQGLDVLYAVYAANGQQLALVADRAMAFHLARAHDATPVSVH